MAKKKPKPPLEALPPGSRHIRVELDTEVQDMLRFVVADARMSMAAWSRSVLTREIRAAYEEMKGR